MASGENIERDEVLHMVEELQRHESEARDYLRTALEQEASRQEAVGRFPFAADWYSKAEVRRLRRQAWLRWMSVRLEGAFLIAAVLFAALVIHAFLLELVPK